jgi:hypothetical protein
MNVRNALLKIHGKRIILFAEAINEVRPGLHINIEEWKEMQPEVRSRKIATLFSMNGFTDDELHYIKKKVLRVKVPYRLIFVCLLIGAIAFTSFRVYQFIELPRIYAIANDVPVTTGIDNSGTVVKRLDLFGQSNAGKSTDHSLLLISDTGSNYIVQDDDFLKWFLGKVQNYYVYKKPCVSKKAEYNEYVRILEKAKGLADLDQLTADDRIAIKACIDKDKELFKAVLEVSKDSTGKYRPFVVADGRDNQRHIFLCLRKQNNQLYNVQMVSLQGILNYHKEIETNLRKTYNNVALCWKMDSGQFPIVIFSNLSTRETYQSLFPPYDTFLPL